MKIFRQQDPINLNQSHFRGSALLDSLSQPVTDAQTHYTLRKIQPDVYININRYKNLIHTHMNRINDWLMVYSNFIIIKCVRVHLNKCMKEAVQS